MDCNSKGCQMKEQNLFCLIILYLVVSLPVWSQAKATKEQITDQAIIIAKKYPSASVSFNLADLGSNPAAVASYNPQTALIPASTVKSITTAAALEILGEAYRFKTILAISVPAIKNGILNGDIILQGSGDPTLGSDRVPGNPDLENIVSLWLKAIEEKGIKEVKGNIVADNSLFHRNTIPDGWIWTDIGNYYGAGATGLNINENQYKLFFKPGKSVGDQADVLRVEPEIPGLTFINNMKTGPKGSGDNGYIYGGIFSNQRYLNGTIPVGVDEFSIKGSMPDPGLFAADYLKQELMRKGIKVSGNAEVNTAKPIQIASPSQILYTHESPLLSEIVKYTNQFSINLYAESLLNAVGLKINKKGDTKSGIDAIKEYFKQKGLADDILFMVDGSGLSPQNAVSSSMFTDFLFKVYHSGSFKPFLESLPVAGQSGTLSSIGRGTEAAGRVFAKSGSFERVLGYAGYVKAKSGKFYAFSILINNYEGKSYEVRKEVEKLFVLMSQL